MLVNSINTELLCGEPKRRPVKILFHPTSEQESLDDCGDQIQLARRNSKTALGFQFLKTGEKVNVATTRLTYEHHHRKYK